MPPSSDLRHSDELPASVSKELFASSPDCIKILKLDGTVKRLSTGGQVALELDTLNQLDGAYWPGLWPGSEQARVDQAVVEGREGRRTQFLAFCPTAKRTPKWWDVVVTPVAGPTSGVSELLVVSRDVTELVRTKKALEEANEQKDAFLAALSHELRNPLSALAMAAKVLEKFHASTPQVAQVSELIQRQVGHMSRLAEDLLDVSRITRGQVTMKFEEFDLRDSVGDLVEQLGPALAKKNQTLQKHIADKPARIRGDRVRLAQVLGNLVGNASRYSPAHSGIRLSIEIEKESVKLQVCDDGQGMSAGLMATLFDMYSQGQASGDRKASGIGMGLPIVKSLVELHGGTVHVESAGTNMGSRFTVLLPLLSPQAN
ncbi:signal transduction histidine kinase [Massilia sp. UYP11]|uniref:sensor histidine kinase n=1 Tax=Massilia sp. UYP11 TaxID=1756385 RepID=UPI003D22638A